jgi:hypothetical protein
MVMSSNTDVFDHPTVVGLDADARLPAAQHLDVREANPPEIPGGLGPELQPVAPALDHAVAHVDVLGEQPLAQGVVALERDGVVAAAQDAQVVQVHLATAHQIDAVAPLGHLQAGHGDVFAVRKQVEEVPAALLDEVAEQQARPALDRDLLVAHAGRWRIAGLQVAARRWSRAPRWRRR